MGEGGPNKHWQGWKKIQKLTSDGGTFIWHSRV